MSNSITGGAKYRAVITGTGSFVPEKLLTNEKLAKMVDTSDEWITIRTGIKVRHIASDSETTAILAVEAAKKALAQAKLAPKDVDIIMVATIILLKKILWEVPHYFLINGIQFIRRDLVE